ncbi:MAG: hypothetical protein FJZ58_03710, partial [Chlamydiae bacterium]|nr:hypothetical protein [Chlamydiota bacterium]
MMRKNIFSLSFFSLAPASLLAVFALPSYTQLPNTELPPDISPSMTSFSWKGNSLSAINAIPSSGLPSQSNTGALVLTPATGSLDGVFPVPGDSSNLLYRSIVELPLGFTTSNSWVRVYATPATFSSVTDGGVDTGFIDNDFLLYSKEAIGSGTSSPGWYNGVSYSYPLGLPEEFATTGIGSFVISPSLSMDAETNETVSRETTSGFILIGTERDGSLGSSGISTFFGPWNDAEIQEGAGGTGAFSGLGNNFLIVSQLAQYVDVSNQTPPPTSDTTTEVYTLFTGEGGFFNRDPNAGSFYESYATVPNLIAMSNATLSNNSYYQYINDPSGNTPSQITGSGV